MHYRKLGTTESEISEIGFGGCGIGSEQLPATNDGESIHALRRAFELGVNFIDTALAYGDGHSERVVGEAVNETIHKVFVATKVPPKNKVWPASPSTPISEVFPRDYVIQATEQSLRNLKIEQIYLQQFHVWTDAWVNADEWRRAIEDLRASGKVRFFGISASEHDPNSCLEAIRTEMFSSVQVIYNVFDHTAEEKLFPLCVEKRVGVLARMPLDAGGLAGSISEDTKLDSDDFRATYFRGDRKKQVAERVAALERNLNEAPGTLAQVALRFCLSNKAVSSVIPGMRRVKTVESSCRAAAAGMLDSDTVALVKRHAWSRNFYQ